MSDQDTFIVENIMAEKKVGNNLYFLVKWQDETQCTWEPLENLQ